MRCKGFEAWVEVEGVKAPMFAIEASENGQNASCWIPSEAGKRFVVRWKDSLWASGRESVGNVYLDADFGSSCYLSLDKFPAFPEADVEKAQVTTTTSRPFVFAPLELTDDDALLESSNAKDMGQIELKLYRCTIGSFVAWKPQAKGTKDIKVHERSKKGLVHGVQYGDIETDQKSSSRARTCRRLDVEPFARFIFRYRPLDYLQANDIAPRPETQPVTPLVKPEPTASRKSAPVKTDKHVKKEKENKPSGPVVVDLCDDIETNTDYKARNKRTGDEAEPLSPKRVKRELPSVSGIVIDLT